MHFIYFLLIYLYAKEFIIKARIMLKQLKLWIFYSKQCNISIVPS